MVSGPRFSVEDFVSLRRVGALAVHPGGTWAAVVVERPDANRSRYTSDLWRVSLVRDEPPARLTRGDHKNRAPMFDALGNLYFLSERPMPDAKKGDDEKRSQVWRLPASGEPSPVTDEPLGVTDFRVGGQTLVAIAPSLPGLARADLRDAFADRKKHGPSALRYERLPVRYWDHWLGPTESRFVAWDLTTEPSDTCLGAPRTLTTEADGRALHEPVWDLSSDGAAIATTWASVSPIDRIDDRGIAVIDTRTGARAMLGVGSGLVHTHVRWRRDAAELITSRYRRTPAGYGARGLYHYIGVSAETGAAREVAWGSDWANWADWDRFPVPWGFSADGEVVASIEDEGAVRAFLVGPAGRVMIGPREGTWHDLVITERGLVGVRSDIRHPPEVFVCGYGEAVAARRSAFTGGLPEVIGNVVDRRFDVDGRSVQAFVVEPSTTETDVTRTLFWIHGGPVAAWLDQWHWRWNPYLMAAYGFRSILPNPAGSTGFGLDWIDDVWGNTWGARCYADLMGVVDGLEAEGIFARDMVVMGGSFGGYMTNWIGGQTERFRLLVTHASLFQLSTFHLATDVPAWWELMMGGSMWSLPDIDRYSPSVGLPKWKTPTLVLHGDKDYRVPLTEGLMLFEALQRHAVPSELVVFPDENHWILRPRNIVAWYEAVLDFIQRRWDAAKDA